ncbi:hypothetical protein ACFQGT_14480 [Natrialbaceae archaeon GCM10025810]|uniref:hypothetical protein n=1 Tax=Halovalidus salilacus TaxID=3075124 RepID=UPI003613C24C
MVSEAGDAGVEDVGSESDVDVMTTVYRHDVHKLRGRRHDAASDEFLGVRVNEDVPLGADRDAALLSRPSGEPEQTVSNHVSPYRLSLLTGAEAGDSRRLETTNDEFRELVTPEDAERLHAAWLTSDVASMFNESVFFPFSSLKFHVLLTAALLDNYRAGFGFDELYLVAKPGEAAAVNADVEAALGSDVVVPHRTVLWSPVVTLEVTGEPLGPAAPLGAGPARSFADVWSRLPMHPFETDGERAWMVLDAQLRRLRSWSVALQFIEEFVARFGVNGDGERSQWQRWA